MVRSWPAAAALTPAGCSYRSVHMLSGARRLGRVQLAARAGTSKEPILSHQGCPNLHLEPARIARCNTITAARASHAFAPLRPSAARLLAGNDESSQRAYVASKQSPEEYHAASDRTLNALIDHLEALTEEHSGVANEREAEYSSGVLTLRLGQAGTYVINKQPPNQQIWLSSPKSGPKRFDYDTSAKQWFSNKEGITVTLQQLLDQELSAVFGFDVKVDLHGDH